MFTRCTQCETVFRITENQLQAREGLVRCGKCHTVFNASWNLVDHPQESPPGRSLPDSLPIPLDAIAPTEPALPDAEPLPDSWPLPEEEPRPDTWPSLEEKPPPGTWPSLEEDAPREGWEIADPGQDPGKAQTDFRWDWGMMPEPELSLPDPPSTTTPAEDLLTATPDEEIVLHGTDGVTATPAPTPAAARHDEAVSQPVPKNLHPPGTDLQLPPLGRQRPPRRALWRAGSTMLILALLAQLAYFFADDAAAQPTLRSWMNTACEMLECVLPPLQDIERVDVVMSEIRPHPKTPGAQRISVGLVNRAAFTQPYPVLEISLTNHRGQILSRRPFAPADYLQNAANGQAQMPVNIAVDVLIDVTGVDTEAVGYTIALYRSRNGTVSLRQRIAQVFSF